MRLVYVAGPYTAPSRWEQEQHVRKAEETALKVAQVGVVPVCPHSMYRHFDGTLTADYWYAATLDLMQRCDGVYLVAGWMASKGARAEQQQARAMGLPVFETIRELVEWLDQSHGRTEKDRRG